MRHHKTHARTLFFLLSLNKKEILIHVSFLGGGMCVSVYLVGISCRIPAPVSPFARPRTAKSAKCEARADGLRARLYHYTRIWSLSSQKPRRQRRAIHNFLLCRSNPGWCGALQSPSHHIPSFLLKNSTLFFLQRQTHAFLTP